MSVEGSESDRFELNTWLSFSQADLGPRSPQELLSSGFLETFELKKKKNVLVASGT